MLHVVAIRPLSAGAKRVLNTIPRVIAGWQHTAWAREGSVNRLFVNGVKIGPEFADTTTHSSGVSLISTYVTYMRGVRLTVGHHRYTDDFTPTFPVGFENTLRGGYVAQPVDDLGFTVAGATKTVVSTAPLPFDQEDFGQFRVTGTVKEKALPTDIPLRRKVQLYNQRSGRLVRETWSDASTGAYNFPYVRGTGPYFVVAFDHSSAYRAVIADNLTAEPMP